ncbi:MAG: hypothetical protein ABIY70_10530 [Capsulimonas sp.]|uniref:hypothetical protein n=1 Tax=Capsulimonas sp. TaxID=2494211 RepID=UPI003264FE02
MTYKNTAQPQLPSPPRNVKASGLSNAFRAFMYCLSLLLVGTVYIISGPVLRDQKLVHGTRTMAAIQDKYIRSSKATKHYFEVQFLAGGKPVVEDVQVTRDEYDAMAIGQKTLVTYLPADPSVCRAGAVTSATAGEDFQSSLMLLLPSLLIAIAGPLMVEFMVRGQLRLLRVGREGTATIESIEKREKGVRIKYSFEADGGRWTGSGLGPLRHSFTPGQTITVVYPPGQPQKSKPISELGMVTLANGVMPKQ